MEPGSMCTRHSLLKLLAAPDAFVVTLLTVGVILVLIPYFAGTDFGLFKVPRVRLSVGRRLRWIGPLVLAFFVLLVLPMWPFACPRACTGASAASNERVRLILSNLSPRQIRVIWRSHEGKDKEPILLLRPGQRWEQGTLLNHVWCVVDAANGQFIQEIVVTEDGQEVKIR
jgi:hypothetical protein